MKLLSPLLAIFLISLSTQGADISLRMVTSSEVPDDLRLTFLEQYLGIQRNDWKLDVPEGYEAKLIFRQRSNEQAMLELTIQEKTGANIFLATAPDRSTPDRVQVSCGDQHKSISTFMPLRDGWKTKFGNPGGSKDNYLFEIWNPLYTDGPLFWCEIHFNKK